MNLIEYILLALSSLLVIVDPLAAVAVQFMLNAAQGLRTGLLPPH
jgi:hypothetical protein